MTEEELFDPYKPPKTRSYPVSAQIDGETVGGQEHRIICFYAKPRDMEAMVQEASYFQGPKHIHTPSWLGGGKSVVYLPLKDAMSIIGQKVRALNEPYGLPLHDAMNAYERDKPVNPHDSRREPVEVPLQAISTGEKKVKASERSADANSLGIIGRHLMGRLRDLLQDDAGQVTVTLGKDPLSAANNRQVIAIDARGAAADKINDMLLHEQDKQPSGHFEGDKLRALLSTLEHAPGLEKAALSGTRLDDVTAAVLRAEKQWRRRGG